MKVQVERDALAGIVKFAAENAAARPAFPALSGILVTADEGRLTVRARNEVSEVEASVEASVEVSGSALMPARLFSQIAGSLPKGKPVNLELSADSGTLAVKAGRSRMSPRAMPKDDFPPVMSAPEGSQKFTLGTSKFQRLVQQVAPAASKETSRPTLMGVMLQLSDTSLTGAATDSYRLFVRQVDHSFGDVGQQDVLVPAETLVGVSKTLSALDVETVDIALADGLVEFTAAGRRICSRLVEGTFPAWERLFPGDEVEVEAKVTFDRTSTLESLKRVSVIASLSPTNSPVAVVSDEDGVVTMSAANREAGDAAETVAATVEGSGMVNVAFIPDYLRHVLESTGCEKVALDFRGSLKPAVFTPVPDSDGGSVEKLRALLMPMRVQQ